MKNTIIINHPFVQEALTRLRDKSTNTKAFRFYAQSISKYLVYEATHGIQVEKKSIQTPIEHMQSPVISENIILFTILRAGLSMLFPAMKLFPASPVGFAGLKRDEKTAIAFEYYWKMPKTDKGSTLLLLDPMLATGGSTLHVLRKLKNNGLKQIKLVCIVSAPEGIEAVHKEFPEIQITTASVDKKLDAKKFIVPGLGDFGDRYFAT